MPKTKIIFTDKELDFIDSFLRDLKNKGENKINLPNRFFEKFNKKYALNTLKQAITDYENYF